MSVCCGRTAPCKTIASVGGGEEGVVRLHPMGRGASSMWDPGNWQEMGKKRKRLGRQA